MLDDILGRTELKEQIADLEAERDRLAAQLEAESERRADAVSEKQAAQERANRLEDRIADLEGKLQQRSEPTEVGFRHEETLRGPRRDAVLSRLESFEAPPEGVLTAYVGEDVPEALSERLGDRTALVRRAAPCLVVVDDAGLVATALRPPIAPEPFVERSAAPTIERSWFEPTGRYALAVIRSDIFAVGVYEGDNRVDIETMTSDVKSDHSKGGFSQSRFERIRDEQIQKHLKKATATFDSVDADRRYVVGDRRLVDEVEADVTAAVDATGKPRPALEDAFEEFWSVRLYGL